VREQQAVHTLTPHGHRAPILSDDAPVLELLRDVVVELQGGAKTDSLLTLELKLKERALVDALDESEGRGNEFVSLDNLLLLGNFLEVVLLVAENLLASTLLEILSQEVDRPVDVNRADEGDQLEVKLFGREWKQERTVLEDLLHSGRDGALDQVEGVLYAALQVGVELVVVESRLRDLREARYKIEV